VVPGAVRGVEGELCGRSRARTSRWRSKPGVQMAATAAELAQLLMCFGRPPSVLLRPAGPLGRISANLTPTPRRQHPPSAPEAVPVYGQPVLP
jgi:hypothetical protein